MERQPFHKNYLFAISSCSPFLYSLRAGVILTPIHRRLQPLHSKCQPSNHLITTTSFFRKSKPHFLFPYKPITTRNVTTTSAPDATLTSKTVDLPNIPPRPFKPGLRLRATSFDITGTVTMTSGDFLKSELCIQHGLEPRDLRKIDTHSFDQLPTVLVRPTAILVNLHHIRALIKADQVILFDSFGSRDSYSQSVFIYDLQERLRSPATDLPFEFRALEAILISVVSGLRTELEVLEPLVTRVLSDLEESIDRDRLRSLLRFSKKLAALEKKADSVRSAIEEVLENDDDLAAMYLTAKKSGHPRPSNQHQEIELLLETYLKQTEEVLNICGRLTSDVKYTDDIVNLILDANRNSLLLLELKVTMATLGVGSGALIASLFGMNLKNFYEASPHAFSLISGGSVFISAIVFIACLRQMRKLSGKGLYGVVDRDDTDAAVEAAAAVWPSHSRKHIKERVRAVKVIRGALESART